MHRTVDAVICMIIDPNLFHTHPHIIQEPRLILGHRGQFLNRPNHIITQESGAASAEVRPPVTRGAFHLFIHCSNRCSGSPVTCVRRPSDSSMISPWHPFPAEWTPAAIQDTSGVRPYRSPAQRHMVMRLSMHVSMTGVTLLLLLYIEPDRERRTSPLQPMPATGPAPLFSPCRSSLSHQKPYCCLSVYCIPLLLKTLNRSSSNNNFWSGHQADSNKALS